MAESRYQAFQAAAEEHSLTRAAEKLGYTQSGISHLIDSLEEELGLKLLVRAKSGTRLTDAGEELLPYVRRLLAAAEDVSGKAGELKGLDTGRVRIGTFSSVAIQWLPELLLGFGEKYPGIETVIFNDTYSAVEDALANNRVDCAFVPLPSRPEFKTVFLASDRLMSSRLPTASRCSPSPKTVSALYMGMILSPSLEAMTCMRYFPRTSSTLRVLPAHLWGAMNSKIAYSGESSTYSIVLLEEYRTAVR